MGRREARRVVVPAREVPLGSRVAAAAVCLGLAAVAASAGTAALTAAPAGTLASTATAAAPVSRTAAPVSRTAAADVVPAPAATQLSAVVPAPSPVDVRVPDLGISSELVRLGVDAAGAVEVPKDPAVAGWYAGGPAPGSVGPAVLVGHVDSRSGPGVFAALHEVAVGAPVEVDREDGSTVRFVVTAVQQVAKNDFPTAEVYGPVAGPELRLITCGGDFDEATGHYVDNVVVFARQV